MEATPEHERTPEPALHRTRLGDVVAPMNIKVVECYARPATPEERERVKRLLENLPPDQGSPPNERD